MGNLIAQIANEFVTESDEVADVITFIESQWGLGFDLFPPQKFLLKCVYGMELDDTPDAITVPDLVNSRVLHRFSEKEFLQWLYDEGRCNTNSVAGKSFNEILLVAGRRGSKSVMASCISAYELYKLIKRGDPQKYYGLIPGSEICILNVGPTDEQAAIIYGNIVSYSANCPYMKSRILKHTMGYMRMQSESDRAMGEKVGNIFCLTGGCSANGLRGHNAIVVIMDEFAFFVQNRGRFSDEQVYKALTPSTAGFSGDGKKIILSSPFAKSGYFYKLYEDSFREEENTLMFKMYSCLLNPVNIASADLKAARRRDRVSFMCEYGGEFSDTITSWIEDPEEFNKCITLSTGPSKGKYETAYYWGLDLGFKNDGSALAIVHKEDDRTIHLDRAEVWFSGSSDVWEYEDSIYKNCNQFAHSEFLKMSDILNEIKELNRWFPCKKGIFDQHPGYALLELLSNVGLKQFELQHFSDSKNHEVYQITKRLYSEKLLALWDHPVLVPELLSLQAEFKSKAKIEVTAPSKRGCHDDISDAFVRACWLCYKDLERRSQNLICGAGGRIIGGTPVGRAASNTTQAGFMIKKRQMHGAHPRGLDKIRRRR